MITILLLYFLRVCVCQQEEPLYAINFDSQVELCDSSSESFVDVSSLRADRFNETTACLDGHIEFLKEIGLNTMVEIVLEKESSGRYEVAATHEISNFCEEVTLGSETIYYSYLKYMSIPEQCPFEPGKYEIKEMTISEKEMPANSSTMGRYRLLVSMFNIPDKDRPEEKELMFCLRVKTVIEMLLMLISALKAAGYNFVSVAVETEFIGFRGQDVRGCHGVLIAEGRAESEGEPICKTKYFPGHTTGKHHKHIRHVWSLYST